MIKIDFHYHSKDLYQIEVYQRCHRAFRIRGIDCRFLPDTVPDPNSTADLFVVQANYLGSSPEKLGRPIIVEERQDSSMPIARDAVALNNVIRFFKGGVVRSEYINVRAERVHLWLLDREATEAACPQRRHLTDKEIRKVQPGIHCGLLCYVEPWVKRARASEKKLPWADRPIDALFIGTTSYGLPTLDRHRMHFCDALRAIRGLNIVCVPYRAMDGGDYLNLTFQSKIIVSPWGYGEVCYRDFEALLAEAVLIKPKTDYVRTLGDVLTNGETYQACEIDASDLEHQMRKALSCEAFHSPEIRVRNRDRVLEWWNEERLIDWWCEQITSSLEEKMD